MAATDTVLEPAEAPAKELLRRVGFWSTILATVLLVGGDAAIVAYAGGAISLRDGLTIQFVLWFLLTPTMVVVALCIHNWAPYQKRLLTQIGVAFMIVYMMIISYNYYIQLTAVRFASTYGPVVGLGMFNLSPSDFHTVAWALEFLGYGVMSLGFVFLSSVFSGVRMEKVVRWILLLNGLAGVMGMITLPLDVSIIGVASFGLWAVLTPISTALIATIFKRF